MRCTLLVFLSVACAIAQDSGSLGAKITDVQLHGDVLRLVDLEGTRDRLQGNLQQIVENGKARMLKVTSVCSTPEFADEWGKRMLEKLSVDDFVDIKIAAYERYLSDRDVKELIAIRTAGKSGATQLSPALKQKLESALPSIQSEIMGDSVRISTKLGAEIGQQIQKEHPDYCRSTSAK